MDTAAIDYGSEQAAMEEYLRAGEARAFALGNRGPVRYGAEGKIHPDILEAYWRTGFYVFEGVYKADELKEIEADFQDVMARLPVRRDATVDAQGRPAIGVGLQAPCLFW